MAGKVTEIFIEVCSFGIIKLYDSLINKSNLISFVIFSKYQCNISSFFFKVKRFEKQISYNLIIIYFCENSLYF